MASKEVETNRVVVCGGGLSGLTAAISALEAGVPVTLLEKGAELGGNAILSGGMIWTYADYDRMRAEIPNGDAMIQWMIHENIDAARTWLATQGVELGPDQRCHEDFGLGRQMQPPQAIEALGKRFVELGGDLRLESSLDSLITDNGVIRGVRRRWSWRRSSIVVMTGMRLPAARGGVWPTVRWYNLPERRAAGRSRGSRFREATHGGATTAEADGHT